MGAITVTEEVNSPVSALRLFKALILDADNLIPKIVPQAVKNVDKIEGDGGPGTIKQLNFAEGLLLNLATLLNSCNILTS